jgi:hypothetical protein
MMHFQFSPDDLRPVIESVVTELLERFADSGEQIAFGEAEAAAMLGVARTTLRDERYRGRVNASLVGRKIRYTKRDLLEYLSRRQWSTN